MIGFVDVKVEMIKTAYKCLEEDEELASNALTTNKPFSEKLSAMNDIISQSRGLKSSYFKKSEKIKLKRLLQEVAYASYATESDSMFIRIEMASIILDIINMYKKDTDSESLNTDNKDKEDLT